MLRARVTIGVISFGAACVAPVVLAQTQPAERYREPIAVQVDDPSGCLDEARFFDLVLARTARARRAGPGEMARTFRVSLAREGGSLEGRLVLVEPTGPTEPRIVRATTCGQAGSALALMAALSVDARAPAGGAESTAPTAAPSAPSRVASASASTAPLPRLPVEAPASHWAFAVGGRADAVAPPGVGLGGGPFIGAGLEGPDILAPEIRLAGIRSSGQTVTTSQGSATPVWLTLDLSLCPLRVLQRVLMACADVDAGVLQLQAKGQGSVSPSRPWVAPGLEGRLEWPGLSLASWAEVLVDLELGVRATLVRDTFYFLDNPALFQVYRAPPLVAHGAVDVGLRFW